MSVETAGRREPGEDDGATPRLSLTLGFCRSIPERGVAVVEWEARPEYGFPTPSGHVIQGGMVATVVDSATGTATRSVMAPQAAFLTADLRLEFHRATRPGHLTARGRVVREGPRVIFCSAECSTSTGSTLRALAVPRSSSRPEDSAASATQ